jgi:carbamoyl-phosphate synthase large subunit
MRILVSGIGGDIGFGVGKVLKNMPSVDLIYGIDIHNDHPGISIFSKCDVAPSCKDSNYISWLEDYINLNQIDLFIPTSEPEIDFLSYKSINKISKADVLISNFFMVKTCLDKHKCLNFLRSSNIDVPEHGIVGQQAPSRFPVIIKPNKGAGSLNISKINSVEEYNAVDTITSSELVWQEYLYPDDQEYTCALFKTDSASPKSIIIKRELSHGFTSKGEIIEDDVIDEYIKKVAEIFKLDGVMNIQLRMTEQGPMLFEINPRLSSTLVFRDILGFSDLQWWVFSKLDKKIPEYHKPKTGTLFYRGIAEYIIK